jgi:hypothetical protein
MNCTCVIKILWGQGRRHWGKRGSRKGEGEPVIHFNSSNEWRVRLSRFIFGWERPFAEVWAIHGHACLWGLSGRDQQQMR